MQIFEFHFNPKLKKDYFFDSFVYEPENAYERKLGSLYLAGDLKNALPQNSKFLEELAQIIKKNYYNFSFKYPGKGLSESLRKANDFLAEKIKKEDVSWLANLNFAVLSVKDFDLTFTKTGDSKILLIRQGQIIDLSQNLNLQEIEPYPLKVFFNVVSGKLIPNDIILVLTKDIFDFFVQQNLLDKISETKEIDKKRIKEILPPKLFTKNEGTKVSGICFLALLKDEPADKNKLSLNQNNNGRTREIISPEKEKFSFSRIFLPIIRPIKNIKKLRLPRPKNPLKLLRGREKPKTEKPNFSPLIVSQLSKISFSVKTSGLKTKLILIVILISLLSFGFLIFKETQERKQKKEKIEISLERIQEKFEEAKRFLIFKEEEKANSLFKEIWLEISFLSEKEISNIIDLKESVEENLENLNKLEKIENPELSLELNSEIGFNPQNILLLNSDLYLYSPDSSKISKFNIEGKKGILLEGNKNFEFGDVSPDMVLFFSKPDTLIYIKNGDWKEETIDIKEFDFSLFSSYSLNLYFWDKKNNQIIKYPHLSNFKWGSGQTWIKNKSLEQKQAKFITTDESIWILNEDNSIDRYYGGDYQETINFDLFPILKNISKIKIKTGVPYLYLLEPKNKRIIITDRNGKIFKQFQSEKFDNLKDFAVSKNGKTIYLLNDWKVYKLEI